MDKKEKQIPKEDKNVVTSVMTDEERQRAAKWQKRFELASSHQEPLFKKWSKWYEDMYAYVNGKNVAPWKSKVYMPIIASKVWDLISRFVQYRPGWEVSVRQLPVNILSSEKFDEYMKEATEKIEKIKLSLDHDYDNPLNEEPIQDELLGAMLDACVTGQGFGRVRYAHQESKYRERLKVDGNIDFSKEKLTTAKEGYNTFESVNAFNMFFSPFAKGLQKSPWIIVHDFVPKSDLEEGSIEYKNLDKIKAGGVSNQFAQYDSARNRLISTQDVTTLDDSICLVEIFECWDRLTGEQITYAKSSEQNGVSLVEIHNQTNPYWHGKYPFVPFYIRRKPYQVWGESIFENTETLQAAINDVFNHHMDSLNMSDGMIAIEENAVVHPYVVRPGGEVRYRGDVPKQFRFSPPDPSQVQVVTNLVNSAIENATISQYASGVANSATDKTQGTATGITRIMEAAAEKVGFMRANFRRSWREVGYMWVSNSQQFLNHDLVVEKVKEGVKSYDVVHPADLIGIWNIKVDDNSFEPVSKDAQRQDYLGYVQFLQGLQASSVEQAERLKDDSKIVNLNFNELGKRGSELFSQNYAHYILEESDITPEVEETPPPEEAPVDDMAAMMEGGLPAEPQAANPLEGLPMGEPMGDMMETELNPGVLANGHRI